MNILMIVPQPFFTPRGTPFSVYYRTKALSDLGHRVDVVTYHIGAEVAIPRLRVHRIPSVPFINKVKIGPSFPKLILDGILFWKTLWMLMTGRYDAIHAHEEGVFFCLVYKLLFPRMRIIYDMHSSLPQQLKNFGFSNHPALLWIFSTLEYLAIRMSSVVITICPDLQKQVEEMKVGTPSVLIENTLFDEIAYPDRRGEISEDMINGDTFKNRKMVLYTGTFEKYQGLPLLMDAAVEVLKTRRDVLFVFIGGQPPQILDMRQKAESLGIGQNVLFTGTLHPNTVKRFIKRTDVLASPRISGTNSPLKLYEYLSSGKPIVATRLYTHTQVLSPDEAVLVDPAPEAFAKGILHILNAPEEGARISVGARNLYEKTYGGAVYADRLQQVLEHVG